MSFTAREGHCCANALAATSVRATSAASLGFNAHLLDDHSAQFALMPAFLMSSAFSLSSLLIIASNSAIDIGSGSAPSFLICADTSGDSTSAVISLCSRSTIGRGVFAATSAPTQKLYAEFG